jgi:hypothetical protein
MNAVALLALIFGFGGMMLLDGQVFTHAMVGIVCGFIATACGVVLARRGREPRWIGWSFLVLGLALAIWCGIESPSAYRYQEKFNGRREQRQKMEQREGAPNIARPNAGGSR